VNSLEPITSQYWNAAASRGTLFLLLWLALSLGNPADLPAGLVATIAATWTSLRLLPPRASRVSFLALATYALRFLLPLMLFIMLTVLMIELQSFQRLVLVLSVAPLGLIGVVAALLVSGRPLGFVAILGILALLGMITKNAVILIGQIEGERKQGKDVVTAAIDASSARFRSIMLTAISTVLGMIPIAPTVFWGPMAFAIMGGLLVATILTLVFLPTIYVAWFGGRAPASGAAQGAHA
jgi:Cu/Ag efflux pump CusA